MGINLTMNIGVIVTNYRMIEDGIGDGAAKIYSKLPEGNHVTFYTGYTHGESVLKRFLSLKMSKQIHKCARDIKAGKPFDAIIIEYPFDEYNPQIIPEIRRLRKACDDNSVLLLIRLHEYFRVRKIRQHWIRKIIKYIDNMIVPDEKTAEFFRTNFNKHVDIIPIPSNIEVPNDFSLNHKNSNAYCYFGLINKSKAFNEMLEAWKKFFVSEKNEKLCLHIISSTEIDISDFARYNIFYHYKANDNEICKIMSECTFGIIPIIPSVSFNSGSFKTSVSCGEIVLGHFDDSFFNNNFMLNIKDYSEASLIDGLIKTKKITEKQQETMCSNALEYGKNFNTYGTGKSILSILNRLTDLNQ